MKQISQAIVKFQASLKPVEKGSENPFYKSNYADLSSILQSVTPVLNQNGLAIIQPMRVVDNGTILITRIVHESGEYIESEMYLPSHSEPQKFGSLISYYKRYQLQALLGISTVDEDDDGNKASGKTNFKNDYVAPKKIETPKPSFQVESVKSQSTVSFPASDAQKNALTKMGIFYSQDITKSEASKLIESANKDRKEGP